MLHLPGVVVAEPVGELDLLERVAEQPVLAVGLPRPRQLVLVEDPEPHAPPAPFSILAQVSRSVTVRLNTGRPGRESTGSTQK